MTHVEDTVVVERLDDVVAHSLALGEGSRPVHGILDRGTGLHSEGGVL